jgi:5-methyltetrahydropteroyltriglutamate--homocysteine methyltransferase
LRANFSDQEPHAVQVLDARDKHAAGKLDDAGLRQVEDKHIEELVANQLKHGLRSISDGEYRCVMLALYSLPYDSSWPQRAHPFACRRRLPLTATQREYFHLDFIKYLDGVTSVSLCRFFVVNSLNSVSRRRQAGRKECAPTSVHLALALTSDGEQANDARPPRIAVTGKVRHSKPIEVDNYKFLKAQLEKQGAPSDAVIKIAIPSPTMVHFRGGRAGIDLQAYPDLDAFCAPYRRLRPRANAHDLLSRGPSCGLAR